jgi:glycolate oxidase FAD binding subunit
MSSGGVDREPGTREELAGLVAAAARDRRPLASGEASIRRLDRVVAHEPGDLTLTAECGITVAAIQELLAPHRQFVALDPPDAARSTLGAVLTSGRDGPLAARFGSVRDQVLGLTVVNGDGRITKCGGRVVKNVTGYDLCRLYAGSGGGLGILVEATLRVRSLPESCRRLDFVLAGEDEALARGLELRARVPEIASIQVCGEAPGAPVRLTAIAAGLEAFVDAACGEVAALLGTPASAAPCDPRAFRIAAAPEGARTALIAALPAGGWSGLATALAPLLAPRVGFVHDVLRGVRESWHAGAGPLFADERRLDEALTKHAATLDCPDDPGFPATLLARFPGQIPGGLELMRALKRALDPAGILNPGGTVYG